MPNWCENIIKITGEESKMKALVEKFKELETNDQPVMGFLLGTEDRPADFDQGGWYGYQIKKFGTKWDFRYNEDLDMEQCDTNIIYFRILTAWSPPCEFLKSLCEKYGVKAKIHYHEPGMGFAGTEEF